MGNGDMSYRDHGYNGLFILLAKAYTERNDSGIMRYTRPGVLMGLDELYK
jgi:hypothetical protein